MSLLTLTLTQVGLGHVTLDSDPDTSAHMHSRKPRALPHLVLPETVLREHLVVPQHDAVSRDLGHHRRRGDAQAACVALHNGACPAHRQVLHGERTGGARGQGAVGEGNKL
eukprot:359108-Chlamydomonas_euryale.AAC.10